MLHVGTRPSPTMRRHTTSLRAIGTHTIALIIAAASLAHAQSNPAAAQSDGFNLYRATLANYLTDHDAGKAKQGYRDAIALDPLLVNARIKLSAFAIAERDWKQASVLVSEALQIGTDAATTDRLRKELAVLKGLLAYGSRDVSSALDPDVVPPSILSKIDPAYTKEARKARVNGEIVIWIEVDENGVPGNIQVIDGLGYGLNEKAIEAVGRWKFKPATKNGHPIRCAAEVTVNFRYKL
jgi:TonB family protein